jgi:hypothetical protein
MSSRRMEGEGEVEVGEVGMVQLVVDIVKATMVRTDLWVKEGCIIVHI